MFPSRYGNLILNIGVFIAILIRPVLELRLLILNNDKKNKLELFNVVLYIFLLRRL